MKTIVTFFIFFFGFAPFLCLAQNIDVKKYKDGKEAAIVLTFDDATSYSCHNLFTREVLNKYNFKGTFELTTNWITESQWSAFSDMVREGHEAASHSVSHPFLETIPAGDIHTPGTYIYELYQSKKIIEDKIPSQKCLTMALPYCTYNEKVSEYAASQYIAGRSCNGTLIKDNLTDTQWQELNSIMFTYNSWTKAEQDKMMTIIKDAVTKELIPNKGWTTLVFHGVVPNALIEPNVSYMPCSSEWLDELCSWLKENEKNNAVWVGTMADVARYIQEREALNIQETQTSIDTIKYLAYDGLEDAIFNVPITVDVTLPADWEVIKFIQGESAFYLPVDSLSSKVRLNILPDSTDIILVNVNPEVIYPDSAQIDQQGKKIKIYFQKPNTYTTVGDLEIKSDKGGVIYNQSLLEINEGVLAIDLNENVFFGENITVSYVVSDSSELESISNMPVKNNSQAIFTSPESYIPTDSLSISASEVSINKGKAVKLKATVNPGNSTDLYVNWRSTNESVAKVNNTGYVKTYEIGMAQIIAETYFGGIMDTCKVMVLSPTKIENLENTNHLLEICPNPVNNIMTFKLPNNVYGNAAFTIYDSKGSQVVRFVKQIYSVENEQTLDLSKYNLNDGFYSLVVNQKSNTYTSRFLLVR